MENVWASIQGAWNGLLDLSTKLVTPDWGSLIALFPVGVLLAVIVVFAWLGVQYVNVGPTRRGPTRVPPRAPGDIHMPGPSFAPVFAALGAFLFFFGLVIGVGKPAFWLGLAALVLTLLYWLREGMRDYDRIEAPHSGGETLPAVIPSGPPPGIHMPGPSFRPLLVSLAAAILFAGLVVGPALLVGGIVLLFISLVGWLGDAGHEYHAVAASDATGHLESAPAPRYPIGTLVAFIVVLVVGIGISAGIVPGTSGEAAGSAAPSGGASPAASASGGVPNPAASGAAPGASGAAGGMMSGGPSGMGGMMGGSSGAGGQAASAAPGTTADVNITAQNIQYSTSDVTAPAGKPFTIAFSNQDAGVPHNVSIHKDSPTGPEVFQGQIVTGPTTVVYNVPALPAGAYAFVCTVHPNMTGTLTVK